MDLAVALLWTSLGLLDIQRPRIAEFVTVVPPSMRLNTPSAVTTLGALDVQSAPAGALDDVLRSVPGFSLFRRSSSRVANPTTQGVTLRGIAASGASRALVLVDDIPLNDAVGGWVYWNRVPIAAINEVSVARGAAGDLYGADALAGVVTVTTRRGRGAVLTADAGSETTARLSAAASLAPRAGRVFGAIEGFTTDGFVTVAPESRGSIDTPAASRHGSGHAAMTFGSLGSQVTIRGSLFRESRKNGTPIQRNSTRLGQLSAAALGSLPGNSGWDARAFVSTQEYRQTFSAVLSGRTAERQTSAQSVEATSYEAYAGYWWRPGVRSPLLVSLLGSARLVEATLVDTPFNAAGQQLPDGLTSATQTAQGASAHGEYRLGGAIHAGGGLRVERSRSGDTTHTVAMPRLWLAAHPAKTARLRLTAGYQSGFRVPTINELYRPFRVGNVLTLSNAHLRPEKSRGFEGGAVWTGHRLTARGLAFWSRVDDAIVNVTLAPSGETILRQRQNAATIGASGAELELQWRVLPGIVLNGASSYTRSTFVRGPLEDLRVPQVPRVQHAAGIRAAAGRARISADWRFIGAQFDDDRNAFELKRSSVVDVRGDWRLRRGTEVFVAIENVLDEEQDVGRTPLRTIGLPRLTRAGVRVAF